MSEFKQELLAIMRKEELNNKRCVDCGSPNPQWTSISFATLLCLSCAGVHRGLGVHISFVRSMTMDSFTADQMKRMRLGGNALFTEFMKSYNPVDVGGYKEGMSISEKYSCWAAKQYKDKLDAMLEDREWAPSAPPAGETVPSRPSSAQGLRKSRTTSRNITSSLSRDSSSPSGSRLASSEQPLDKSANEHYFAGLGEINANRPDHLPPNQGGKYTGFGSTPPPQPSSSQHPSFGLSSASAPSVADFQSDPVRALSRGWSLLSTAIVGASRTVTENVLDPSFTEGVKGVVTEATKKASAAGKTANEWGRAQLGVDVAGQVGDLYGTIRDNVVGVNPGGGYDAVPTHTGFDDDDRLYGGEDHEDFFQAHGGEPQISGRGTAAQSKNGDHSGKTDDWENSGWGKDDEWN